MKLLILIFSIFTLISFSQETDSIKPKQFQNFFGSDCVEDTVVRFLAEANQCILYKKENKLTRIDKGKIKWTLNLQEELDFGIIECDCLFPRNSFKSKRKTLVIVSFNKGTETWAAFIRFHNGKIIQIKQQI